MGLYILVPLSVVLVFVIGIIFWWSVRSGQFDDLEGPGFRMLVDDRDEMRAGPDKEPGAQAASEAETVLPPKQEDGSKAVKTRRSEAAGDGLDTDQTPPAS